MIEINPDKPQGAASVNEKIRLSSQRLLPQRIPGEDVDKYQIYPYHSLGKEKIFAGYSALASWMGNHRRIIIDGYSGVIWKTVRKSLQEQFERKNLRVQWIDIAQCLHSASTIQSLVKPFLGPANGVWGKKTDHGLRAFFDMSAISNLHANEDYDLCIVYGTGAALTGWEVPMIYFDVPKNEVQYRMRARSITNLGAERSQSASEMYKRFYFVDWVVLNAHKKEIFSNISIIVDGQWNDDINWSFSESLQEGLMDLSQDAFRVRPWFEPGAWGGQWMKNKLKGINRDEINYAWSFEMIVPENGIVFESDGNLLEISFDFLMYAHGSPVLGKHHADFGDEFPIRFDFLDTWDGGNLSIQCHPSLTYIREQFGEYITQDETYYIMDCKPGAKVYLGFQENISPKKFREDLENSKENNEQLQVDQYIQTHTANKHDLFLIPNGTVHSAGANNLVLEISATPYIFTFKMYDWLRLDLNGEPRAINIEHAFNNLRFDRKGGKVTEELISRPVVLSEIPGQRVVHLPTHKDHFYDVHRLEFETEINVHTDDACHVLMLVEGESILVRTPAGKTKKFNYAETFVIPAAAVSYTLVNKGHGSAKVVKAFVKDDFEI